MTLPFAHIGNAEWKLSDTLNLQRRRWLLDSPPYDQIVHNILRGLSGVEVKRERSMEKPGYYRAVVTLHVDAAALDQFHSSASGYRAQYYENPALGSKANRFALDILLPRVRELVADCNKRTCPASWVAQSLQDSDAKLWIHQGLWLRQARKSDRSRLVPLWLTASQQDADKERRKMAMWSTLTPANETRLELMGGFLSLEGIALGTLKPDRGKKINELGFT
ncbi:MAG: hypothetical protein WA071_00935 [Undibacterium umbellatum]|uniref:hypothetical protein n=1 Tax=Undibacterium umbellatum TaxID=2762300 RepID=UPI003BB8034B